MDTVPIDASAPLSSHSDSNPETSTAGANHNPKLPPCDQCRRRKVKCQQSNDGPCDRCVQSALNCTREIQRKKRGPKKGSGSVIAKLRGESDNVQTQEIGLPPFNLASLDMQLPGLRRAMSNESAISSPMASPIGSQFADTFGPTSNPSTMPRSVPLGLGDGISPMAGGYSHGSINLLATWQMNEDQSILQYPSPASPSNYVSVSDLAQQIFHDQLDMVDGPLYQTTSGLTATASHRPDSIDSMLTCTLPTAAASPAGTATSSPRPMHGPKFLYRSHSGSFYVEIRLIALAAETGLSAYLMSQCLRQYFRHLYAIYPVLHEGSLMKLLNSQEDLSVQDKILVLSMCAITVTHAAPPSDLTLQNKQDLSREFLKQCLHLRYTVDWIENATLTTIISIFFMSLTHFELKQVRSHHFYLREAIGLAREMHIDEEQASDNRTENVLRRRMLALLFITERGCAILRNKPISMMRLRVVPSDYFDEHDETVVAGFSALSSLFALLDDKFVELWHASTPEEEPMSSPLENVAAIQHGLNAMSFENTKMTDIQKADVLVTHQWLRLIFWQASMRKGLISSNAADPVFFYNYPITVAKDLCNLMRQLELDAILVHGLGIFEKVFEVAYTLMDALTIAKIDWATSDDLRYLFACLSSSPNSHNTYVKVLENKINIEDPRQSPMHAIIS